MAAQTLSGPMTNTGLLSSPLVACGNCGVSTPRAGLLEPSERRKA